MKYKNTLQKGSVRYIVFKEDNAWYAVALEFNIIESGDDPREVLLSLFEAINGYVKSAINIKARPRILNQVPGQEYEDMWQNIHSKNSVGKNIPKIYTFGQRSLAVV